MVTIGKEVDIFKFISHDSMLPTYAKKELLQCLEFIRSHIPLILWVGKLKMDKVQNHIT